MKKSKYDLAIAENDEKIRVLMAVNDALKAFRDAKKKLAPKPLRKVENP
jgi:hypothetical protein